MRLQPPRKFWLPKAGNRPHEYEDASLAVYPQRIGASGRRTARAVVADGASESAFAREWANILTGAFVDRPPDLDGLTEDSLSAWLLSAQGKWHSAIPWDRLPWHGEAKARAGAFATLLGLIVGSTPEDPQRLCWQALAVGDSCLFVVREGRLQVSFPLGDADEFDNSPALVCSNPANAAGLWESVRLSSGECAPGDLLILATDALARWFLASHAASEKPWKTLLALDTPAWDSWIKEQRRAGSMHNDDTTLIIIEVV